jgi:Na+(H+)/acetate symporter ActP
MITVQYKMLRSMADWLLPASVCGLAGCASTILKEGYQTLGSTIGSEFGRLLVSSLLSL